jgi:outer membrane protein assembly factor BamB
VTGVQTCALPICLTTESEPIRSVWRSRPGGTATSTATFGDLTLITTSGRQLVAYDRYGRWVWQAPLPDQAVVAPVRLADLAVVATLDGNVTAVDLATGQVAWTQRVSDAVRLPPQAWGDRVVVADLSQTVTCFGTDGSRLWSEESLAVSNLAIAPGPDPIVVLGIAGRRGLGLALSDGVQRWSSPQEVAFVSMFPLDQVVAVRDGNLTIGLDPHTGATAWVWDKARTYAGVGQGTHLLLLGDDRLFALDSHGNQLKDWPLPLAGGAPSASLSLGTDRVLVWSPRSVLLGVAT